MMSRMFDIARSKGDPRILSTGKSSLTTEDRLGRALGWLSIGIGVAELVGARRLSRAIGLEHRTNMIRAFGAREIASGVTTLSSEKQVGLWSRVLGDALDLAVLAGGLRSGNPKRGNLDLAIGVVGGIALLDILTATLVSRRHARQRTGVRYADRSGYPRGLAETRAAVRQRAYAQHRQSEPAMAVRS